MMSRISRGSEKIVAVLWPLATPEVDCLVANVLSVGNCQFYALNRYSCSEWFAICFLLCDLPVC